MCKNREKGIFTPFYGYKKWLEQWLLSKNAQLKKWIKQIIELQHEDGSVMLLYAQQIGKSATDDYWASTHNDLNFQD
jgi:hypothetical protein